ncbi:class I SAM-dependent methyltransferase [Caballeronia sp. LZ001]|uniref:class I SAM-dependent methyltransferase n=1 Tax=Caballeronia sp. LZ001 TaxID=3038553 RepID=UPI0028645BCB|nr:class I SAM-dependent methyltransferase [Caballeronia sp. LZ001]MDR5806269.1 class I SAM-dependent methyltransferase [Caballeronia sp. LZ001]
MNTTMSMSFKTRMKRTIKWRLIAVVAALPDWVQTLLFVSWIRRFGERVPVLRVLYNGCYRTHPIDRMLGTDTGGIYPPESDSGPGADAGNLPYMGSQPSIVRHALQQLGDVRGSTFIDIGCGKGRPMIVATEFPFDAVLGYDLAEPLIEIANRNAEIVARRFPQRIRMQAFVENALELAFPKGDLVVFLFNPFGAALMATLLNNLEKAVADATIRKLTVVYIYPVCAHVFDQSPILTRQLSCSIPYDSHEIGYGAESEQTVIVWSNAARTDV